MNYENEKWSCHLPDRKLDICEKNYDEFFDTMLERQLIWKRRFIDNKNRPWTTNQILRDNKFTNVYRSLDKNSMWEIEHIILNDKLDLKNLIWKILFFRLFNNPITFSYEPPIIRNLFGDPITVNDINDTAFQFGEDGIPNYDDFNANDYLRWLKKLRSFEQNPFTNAYLISSKGDRDTYFAHIVLPAFHDRLDELIEKCQTETSAEKLFKCLKTFPNIADFMAFQLYMDLTYVNKFTNHQFLKVDENSATTIGPGSGLGLRLIFPSAKTNKEQLEKLTQLTHEAKSYFDTKYPDMFPYLHFDKTNKQFYVSNECNLTLSEIEQWLCEYAKYWKMKIGEGKQRSKFEPQTKKFNTIKNG